jgi:hypothetical protein
MNVTQDDVGRWTKQPPIVFFPQLVVHSLNHPLLNTALPPADTPPLPHRSPISLFQYGRTAAKTRRASKYCRGPLLRLHFLHLSPDHTSVRSLRIPVRKTKSSE